MVAVEVEGGAQQRYFEGQLIGLASGLDVVHEGRVRDVSKAPDSATSKKGFGLRF